MYFPVTTTVIDFVQLLYLIARRKWILIVRIIIIIILTVIVRTILEEITITRIYSLFI